MRIQPQCTVRIYQLMKTQLSLSTVLTTIEVVGGKRGVVCYTVIKENTCGYVTNMYFMLVFKKNTFHVTCRKKMKLYKEGTLTIKGVVENREHDSLTNVI